MVEFLSYCIVKLYQITTMCTLNVFNMNHICQLNSSKAETNKCNVWFWNGSSCYTGYYWEMVKFELGLRVRC